MQHCSSKEKDEQDIVLLQLPTGQIKMQPKNFTIIYVIIVATPHGSDKNATE